MKTDFNRELEKVKNGEKHSILIDALVNEPTFIDCLFDEFKQTPLKKDVSKYLSQFNTDKEKEKELNAMIKDFYSLKETPKEFYTHDITKTNIYQNFKAIEAVTRELRQTMIEPEKKAEIISNITATLHPNIKKLVINTLIKDNDNIYLNLNFVFGNGKRATQNEKEKWEFVKVVFNDKLSESLLSQIETKIIDLPNSVDKTNNNNDYSAIQWSAIFYYVEHDIYGEVRLKKDKIEKFRKDFNVSHTQSSLSNDINEIARVINGDKNNELRQHHINTIKAILPYLEKNYIEAFENAKDDLSILKDELDRK